MNQTAVTDCMSQAIVDVAEREFNRLRKGMSDVAVARSVEGALQSLKGLAWGKMPSYDDWTTPFYLTWYHPNHVNLAYSLIAAMLKNTGRELPKDLHLLDFGCGTMATQFGLALAIADLRSDGTEGSVRVRPIDTSESMFRLGEEVWYVFGEFVRKVPELGRLSAVMDSMRIIKSDKSPPVSGEEHWLSAMHVVYQRNRLDVRDGLALHADQINPHVGLITSHDDSNSRWLARSVSPFEDERVYSHHPSLKRVNSIFNGGLPEVTQWRWQVEADILNSLSAEAASNLSLITNKGYLGRAVAWQWRDAACRVYTRIG